MTFMRKFNTLLRNSDNKIYILDSEDGINISVYDMNFKLLSSKKIADGSFSFVDYWFDLTSSDQIYGIINNKIDSLIYIRITDRLVVKSLLLKYDPETTFIKFITIKNLENSSHIFYYKLDKLNSYAGTLIHNYKEGSTWHKSEIDSFSYNVLTNFVVTYDNDFLPTIFYYKLVNGFEEVFTSTFNKESCTWSDPIQITDSKKVKIYLSVIIDSKNFYHIIFSENNFNKYYCNYIHGYISNNNFIITNNWKLSDTIACTFPNIIEANNIIYAHWIEYHSMYIRISDDYGSTWSNTTICGTSSSIPFVCCNYHSNKNKYNTFNYFTLFVVNNSDKILGLE